LIILTENNQIESDYEDNDDDDDDDDDDDQAFDARLVYDSDNVAISTGGFDLQTDYGNVYSCRK